MFWRKCLVRSLVFSVLGAVAAAGWLYLHWTDPEAVRQHVVSQLEAHLLDTNIRVDSASLRLLGGVSLFELRIRRKENSDQGDLLYAPEAVIYHDKEQMLQGHLAIRKIELHRPRVRVIRGRDGRWNVDHLLGPTNLDETVPTIVVEQGTFLFEDRFGAPDLMPVEIKNVNLTLVNDPLPSLEIVVRGTSDLLGPVQARLVYQRSSDAMTAAIDTQGASFGSSQVQRVAAYSPELAGQLAQLEGTVRFHANLERRPDSVQPWSQHIRCQLSHGKLSHPQLPLNLEDLEARLGYDDGRLTVESLTAHAGPTRLALTATADAPSPDANLSGTIKIEKLQVNRELIERLPEALHDIQHDYGPTGPVNIQMEFSRRSGQWTRHFHLVDAEAALSMCSAFFPYSVEHITGYFDQTVGPGPEDNVREFEFHGKAGARPVHLKGIASGAGNQTSLTLDIWGDNIPLDAHLQAALPEKVQPLAESFHPTGLADFVASLRRTPGSDEVANTVKVHFHDAALSYDAFPYPLEKVSGNLDILPDHWEFHDFRGSHNGGEFQTWGKSHPAPGGDRVEVGIRGNNILLDDELRDALTPRGKPDTRLKLTWAMLHPGGRLNLSAAIDQLPQQAEDIDVTVTARGCSLCPDFFPYALGEVSGTVRYAHGRVDLTKFTAHHGTSVIDVAQGQVVLKPGGGFYARLCDIDGNPLLPDEDFLNALPPPMRTVCRTLHLVAPLRVNARELVVDAPPEPNMPPVVYWDGGVRLTNAALSVGVDLTDVSGQFWCRARHNGREMEGLLGNVMLEQASLYKQPLHDVCCHVQIAREAPEVVRLPGLQAQVFGGNVGGEARIEFGPTLHYEVNLTATQVHLEEFGRHNLGAQTEFSGQAMARLHLTGSGTDIQGLEGQGSIEVPSGKMYNLPVLLDLLKLIGLRTPDRTAFEEAKAAFSIKGPRVTVRELDLLGNAISLSGQGEMNLDGSDVNLDFYAVWGRIMQVLPASLKPVPPWLAQQVLKIKMRGKMENVQLSKELVPFLTEPLERLLKQSSGPAAADEKKTQAASGGH